MVKFQSVGQVGPGGGGIGKRLGACGQDVHDTERLVLGKACSWLFGAVYHCHSFPNGRA